MRGDRLKYLRESLGYSRQKIADLLEVGEASIPRWEAGTIQPSADTLGKLAIFFGVSADYLLGLIDDPHGFYSEDMSVEDRKVLNALKSGNKLEAVKIIVGE